MSLWQRFFPGTDVKKAGSWALFDFANSSYSLLIITFVFPIYFKEVIAGAKYGDLYWGIAVSGSIVLAGIIAPIMGAMTDVDGKRKKRFIVCTLLAIVGTGLLYFSSAIGLVLAMGLFMLTNIFFELAIVLYDSFLATVSTAQTAGRISGLGWGLGYLGGMAALFLLEPLYGRGYSGELGSLYLLTFPLNALFFVVCSLPAMIWLPRDEYRKGKRRKIGEILHVIRAAGMRVRGTFQEIRRYTQLTRFIAAFYFMNDALVTLFAFISLYAVTTLQLPLEQITGLLVVIHIVAFPAALLFGWLSDRYGPKRILSLALVVWMGIVIGLSVVASEEMFYGIAVLAGIVIGSSQAIARSWFSSIVPEEKRTEFFGFAGFTSKIAAVTGPLVFGVVSVATGSQRWAMISLLPFFVISWVLFRKVEEKGKKF